MKNKPGDNRTDGKRVFVGEVLASCDVFEAGSVIGRVTDRPVGDYECVVIRNDGSIENCPA